MARPPPGVAATGATGRGTSRGTEQLHGGRHQRRADDGGVDEHGHRQPGAHLWNDTGCPDANPAKTHHDQRRSGDHPAWCGPANDRLCSGRRSPLFEKYLGPLALRVVHEIDMGGEGISRRRQTITRKRPRQQPDADRRGRRLLARARERGKRHRSVTRSLIAWRSSRPWAPRVRAFPSRGRLVPPGRARRRAAPMTAWAAVRRQPPTASIPVARLHWPGTWRLHP